MSRGGAAPGGAHRLRAGQPLLAGRGEARGPGADGAGAGRTGVDSTGVESTEQEVDKLPGVTRRVRAQRVPPVSGRALNVRGRAADERVEKQRDRGVLGYLAAGDAAAHDADRQTAGERGWIEARVEQGRFRPPEGTPLWRVLQGERLVHLADAMADDSYHHAPAYARVIDAAAARTVLLVPLRKDDALLGVITAFRRGVRPFSEKEVALLQNFAAQAVIAIENTRLFNELRKRTDELSRSLNDLRTAQDRLVQTEKLASLGQLTAGIAHEIKNPLNFVNNFSALSAELVDELDETLAPASLDQKMRGDLG